MVLEWKQEYSVHVALIDEQHKEFIRLINNLYAAINKNTADKEVRDILLEVIGYAKKHFSTEEGYFDKFNYEGAAGHKEAHANLLAKAEEFLRDYDAGNTDVVFKVEDFLEDWFIRHDMFFDKKYTKCFNEHGLH